MTVRDGRLKRNGTCDPPPCRGKTPFVQRFGGYFGLRGHGNSNVLVSETSICNNLRRFAIGSFQKGRRMMKELGASLEQIAEHLPVPSLVKGIATVPMAILLRSRPSARLFVLGCSPSCSSVHLQDLSPPRHTC